MKRFLVAASAMVLGLGVHAAQGKHIARAVLQAKTGATVASVQADGSGRVRFTNVPPGEYKLVLTNAEGRSVSVGDLDGDGTNDIVIAGTNVDRPPTGTFTDAPAKDAAKQPASGLSAGKVNVQDISITKRTTPAGGSVVSPRDAASGLPTGRRMHKPYACLVDWDGSIKGGFQSERIAQAAGEQLPENANGRCAIKVLVDEQPGTIEILSFSWGVSNHTKTGHVTLME